MPVFTINGKTILFIHVPKTGGTTIEKLLSSWGVMSLHSSGRCHRSLFRSGWLSKPVPLQHLHASPLEQLFDLRQFDHVFAVVRDPVERLISEYRHARALGRPEARLPFPAWLRISLTAARIDPGFRNNHFRPQSDFLRGLIKIHHFEDGLAACLAEVAATVGVELNGDIPHWRTSDQSLGVAVASRDIDLIRRTYRTDYERFARYRVAANASRFPGTAAAGAAYLTDGA